MRAFRPMACMAVVALAIVCTDRTGASATTRRATPAACATPTDLGPRYSIQGAQIPTRHGTIWSLAFNQIPPKAGDEVKIVWRITGVGPLKVGFKNPAGKRKQLVAGPTKHGSSNFNHPGDEYGTVFAFDEPGCWTIKLSRSDVRATVRVTVT